jgi:cytochrome c oxidase cbb3-type subunit III
MIRIAGLLLLGLLVASCEREERNFRAEPAGRDREDKIALTTLAAGQQPPVEERSGFGKAYEENAYHMSRGKTLFTQFNCSGCHGNGGGGSGPPLMDDAWTYGSQIENIVATIREGRPNGMPSFRGKIADEQIWQIAAFVRSMGRYVPKHAAPSRNDSMHARPSENRLPPGDAVDTNPAPPTSSMPQ